MTSADGRAEIVDREGRFLGWLAAAFGTTIIASHIESGQARWSAAAWSFALEVPGSPATWGAVILAGGAALLCGLMRDRRRLHMLGAWIGFVWFIALAVAALLAFSADLFDDRSLNLVNPLSMLTWVAFASMYQLHIQDEDPQIWYRFHHHVTTVWAWVRRA